MTMKVSCKSSATSTCFSEVSSSLKPLAMDSTKNCHHSSFSTQPPDSQQLMRLIKAFHERRRYFSFIKTMEKDHSDNLRDSIDSHLPISPPPSSSPCFSEGSTSSATTPINYSTSVRVTIGKRIYSPVKKTSHHNITSSSAQRHVETDDDATIYISSDTDSECTIIDEENTVSDVTIESDVDDSDCRQSDGYYKFQKI